MPVERHEQEKDLGLSEPGPSLEMEEIAVLREGYPEKVGQLTHWLEIAEHAAIGRANAEEVITAYDAFWAEQRESIFSNLPEEERGLPLAELR